MTSHACTPGPPPTPAPICAQCHGKEVAKCVIKNGWPLSHSLSLPISSNFFPLSFHPTPSPTPVPLPLDTSRSQPWGGEGEVDVKVERKDGLSPSHFPTTSPCPFSFTSPSPLYFFLPTSTPPSPSAGLMRWRTWLMPHLNWCWPPPIPRPPLGIQCKYIISTWKLIAHALAHIPALVPAPPSPYNSPSPWLWPRGIERERGREN